MKVLLTFLATLLASCPTATSFDTSTIAASGSAIGRRVCGTGEPGAALVSAHAEMSSGLSKRASPPTSNIVVPLYFHIVTTIDQKNMVSRSMIANQLGVMQAAYASSGISFALMNTDYTVNDTWATDENGSDMKKALRRGSYSALNIYFQTNLSTRAYGSPEQLLGYCALPTNITYSPCSGCALVDFPPSNYAMDGCNILAGSMPNGPILGYNQGKTAVHEVGHWFGLLHTFQDNSCSSTSKGDFIDDTPQQSVSTDGCPTGKDSCPNSPGVDAIHNYMDYSTDACYQGFSAQQTTRMKNMFAAMRYGH